MKKKSEKEGERSVGEIRKSSLSSFFDAGRQDRKELKYAAKREKESELESDKEEERERERESDLWIEERERGSLGH